MELDVAALEEFLKNPPPDFRYAAQVRAALDFRRALFAPTSAVKNPA